VTGSTLAHIIIGTVAIAAVTVMACYHATISGAEAVTVIIAVLVGSGIIAATSLNNSTTTGTTTTVTTTTPPTTPPGA
jgi:hypothetical protein